MPLRAVRTNGAVVGAILLAVVAVGPAALGAPIALAPRSSPASPATLRGTSASIAASVNWNGQPATSADSVRSAFGLSKGQTATVVFTYTQISVGQVTNATLAVTYLGIVLTTSRSPTHVTGGPPITGTAVINWSFGSLADALQGVFQLTASLGYANGSTAWSQSFYVFVKTPYLLESGATVVFLILAIAELYWGLASVRDARRARPPAAPATIGPAAGGSPPTTPPTGPGEPTSTPGSSETSPPGSGPSGGGGAS